MLERLRGVEGVPRLVDAPQYPDSIVMEDAGRMNLAELAKPLTAEELIQLAARLTRALAGMHGHGVMHRDIAPANIVLSPAGAPCLVDFALATAFVEIRPEFTHPSEIVGSLPYLAPEQTGRTGRPVDQRADLYALGATFYELATSEPPFGSGDPLRLSHAHLARVPVAPAEANPALPGTLSEIVMRLLEKEPDRRYQSAEGVLYDLERLRDGQTEPIGAHDVPPRLLAPSRLVGRDDEVAALEAAFEAARTGRCGVVLVTGAPGVGKTALVNELRPAVTGRDGWFVGGKFDQYRRDLEFDGVYQVFRALGRLLLAEPEDELAELRERILEALSPNAGLTTAVVPEFTALLAVPPDPGDPLTAQVRAQRNTVELLRAIAEELRELAHEILPADLARGGLRGGVDAVVERLDLDVKVDLPRQRFPAEIEASAYFIVAEALTNIVKHAHAESAEVNASILDGLLQLEVRDDGIGGADPGGRGLVGLNDRATALGGRLSVQSPAGSGTVLTATLPISQGAADTA